MQCMTLDALAMLEVRERLATGAAVAVQLPGQISAGDLSDGIKDSERKLAHV